MKESITECGNSDINQNNKYFNRRFNKGINNKIMNILYLVLIIILIIIIIVFISIYFSKIKKYEVKKSDLNINNNNKNNYNINNNSNNFNNSNNNGYNNYDYNNNYYNNNANNNSTNSTNSNSTNNNTNEIICEDGLFLPEDDKTNCIKCSIENCTKCFGSKLNHFCHKCEPDLISIYEDHKIILCSICEEGYYLINGECKKYSFIAKYRSDGSEITFISSFIDDIGEIKEMYLDGTEIDNPSIKHNFNDYKDHEVIMLVDIPESINPDISMYQLFQGIDKMISIRFSPFFNTSKVYDMSYMFDGCSSLVSIGLSNFDTSYVEDMGHMFFGCHNLESIGLSNFNTSIVTNMALMFDGCYSLTSINLSGFKTKELKTMNSIFFNCSLLTSIDLSSFETSNVYNMESMFYFCSRLSYINILNFHSSKSKVELFNQNISSSGTIITNNDFNKTLDKSYIPGWKISIL